MQQEIFQVQKPIIYDIMFNFPKKEHELIKNEKKNIEDHYGKQPRSSSIPHITLCSFLVMPDRAEKVIINLKQNLGDLGAIKVSFNGYDVFSNKVIYAKLESKISFMPFFKMLKTFRFDNYYKEKNFKVSENPHATLARIDDNKFFNLIAQEYKSKTISSTFILDNLVIRKQCSNNESTEYENIRLKCKKQFL